jgi:pimeloyl-ACP methyl ester carboxylesterase
MARVFHINSNGARLYVKVIGSGKPILIMHGGPGADHTTMLSLKPLSNHFTLIYYDHRCNGRSIGASIETVTWENLTFDAETIRKTLCIDKWAVVGSSFGGTVALEYAIRYPQNLSHLCLLDTCADGKALLNYVPITLAQRGYQKKVIDYATRFFSGQIGENELVKSMLILGKAYYSNHSVFFFLKEIFNSLRIQRNSKALIYCFKSLIPSWSVINKLNNIVIPTLIIAGENDFLFPPEYQEWMSLRIVGSKLILIENAGHNAHIEKPDIVNKEILDFIKVNA